MRSLVLIAVALHLSGCGGTLTRLVPKVEKIELPEELMKPPKELKTIQKPPVQAPQPETQRDVTPK